MQRLYFSSGSVLELATTSATLPSGVKTAAVRTVVVNGDDDDQKTAPRAEYCRICPICPVKLSKLFFIPSR